MLHILLLLLALSSSSLGADVTLSSVTDFTEFVNSVNSGTTYSGTTVYLGTDITLTGNIDPIGKDDTYYFLGVFDGQGHVISSLTIESSLTRAGLFGYSDGLTIKNVVLDDSCSITSTFTGNANVNIGRIIGWCYAISAECKIENSVNMAGVSFNGKTTGEYGILYIGGIAGNLLSYSSYNTYVKNCVNYGSVIDSGTISDTAYLGGIVGQSYCLNSQSYTYIQNCLNYGTITYVGTSSILYDGGVTGYSYGTYIENCVSAGKITTQTAASLTKYIGSIVGKVNSNTYINYCYYTNDVTVSSLYGTGTPSSTTGTPTSSTDIGSELVNNLNSNAASRNWDNWFMLHLNGGSINNLAQELLVEIQGHIPNPAKEGNSFLFWCKDAECIEEFDPETELVSGITDLYAGWVNNTVTFDFDNGTTVDVTFAYNTEIMYPDMEKEGYTFSQWGNYHKFMPARDITVTAQWAPNNYTVTFGFDNGTTVNATFTYNTEIAYPDVKKEGYTFSHWSNYHEFMPAKNITVTAQWTPNNYTVTFDFDNGTTVNETFSYNTEIVYPDMKKEGYTLSWNNYHELMPAKNITVTAQWTPNNYTVTFDFDNGTTVNETFIYNTEIAYPENSSMVKEGYTFSQWSNYHELIPARDITVTAQWAPNNYTVAFDANGGNVSETSKIVTFNEKYDYLPTSKKEGYMFLGWFTSEINGIEVTNETIVTTPYNHTLYAHWEEVTTQVEIVFSTKDLTQEEVEKLIEQYTNADFEITQFENESGEIRVIIGFTDKEDAEEFVRNVKGSSNAMNMVKRIGFDQGIYGSFSTTIYPLTFLSALFL